MMYWVQLILEPCHGIERLLDIQKLSDNTGLQSSAAKHMVCWLLTESRRVQAGVFVHILSSHTLISKSSVTTLACSLQQLSTWYVDCLRNHEACKRESSFIFYRPTRLLDTSRVAE